MLISFQIKQDQLLISLSKKISADFSAGWGICVRLLLILIWKRILFFIINYNKIYMFSGIGYGLLCKIAK